MCHQWHWVDDKSQLALKVYLPKQESYSAASNDLKFSAGSVFNNLLFTLSTRAIPPPLALVFIGLFTFNKQYPLLLSSDPNTHALSRLLSLSHVSVIINASFLLLSKYPHRIVSFPLTDLKFPHPMFSNFFVNL